MKLLILILGLVAFTCAEQRQCNAPQGGGLNGIIDEVIPLIPKIEMYLAVLTAINSEELLPLREYLVSDEFAESLKVLENHEAFISIVKSTCKELYFDGIYYYNKMAGELGVPHIKRPVRSVRAVQSGILELIKKLMDLVPKEKLQKIFEEKVKSDIYVQKALKYVFSKDLKSKVETLIALPEYTHFLSKLREVGVEVDEIFKMVNDLLKKLASYVLQAA